MRTESFRLRKNFHLGDIINFVNAVYNLAIQEDFQAEIITRNSVITQLLNIFDYEDRIKISIEKRKFKNRFSFSSYFDDLCIGSWCKLTLGFTSLDDIKIKKFYLPQHKLGKITKKNYLCYQLNCYSCGAFKRRLNYLEIKKVLNLFDKGNSYYISKPNTTISLPDVKIHFADLINQSKFLLGSSGFFGIDSGMSHLAGSLGVKGDVIIQRRWYPNYVQKWYNFMYPTLKMHPRSILY